jgi:hypothetical protein
MTDCARVFLLSPASLHGRRGQLLLGSQSADLARRLHAGSAVPLGEVFTFISSLYFRGKLTYARAFAANQTYVITTSRGLLPPDTPVTLDTLHEFSRVPIDENERAFVEPLERDVQRLSGQAGEVVLLGSVASSKYTGPLLRHLGARLVFPATFVGRGDMSRGGVLLRAVREGTELEYAPVAQTVLRGRRPPKLPSVT